MVENRCVREVSSRKLEIIQTRSKIEVWERKVLRKILGGRYVWKRRTNKDTYNLFNKHESHHMMRMETNRIPKIMTSMQVEEGFRQSQTKVKAKKNRILYKKVEYQTVEG